MVVIAGTVANPLYSLIARPQIKSFADLKGKVIGLSLPIDTISLSTRKLPARNHLAAGDYRVTAAKRCRARSRESARSAA